MAVYRGYVKVAGIGGSAGGGVSIRDVVEALYPVGSVYAAAVDTQDCPIAELLPGSEWEKISDTVTLSVSNSVSSSVSVPISPDVSVSGSGVTAPVKGTGIALGLWDGNNNGGLLGGALNDTIALRELYGESCGTSGSTSSHSLSNRAAGITTDSSKSGMVADLGSVSMSGTASGTATATTTGSVNSESLQLRIWKRTA